MSRRLGLVAGLGVAGAAGYYLYSAGGNPKVAEKQFEHDASKLSSKIKSDLPGTEKEVKTGLKLSAEQAGQKIDGALAHAKDTTSKVDAKLDSYRADAEKKLEGYRQETGKNLNAAVDKFDKTVEHGAAQSKSWISSLFGGK